MSDIEGIDPNLDDSDVPGVTADVVKPARNLLNFFKGQQASETESIAGPSEPSKKRAPRQKKNAAAEDNKQTRLGAGLKPVKIQPDVQVEGDEAMLAEVPEPGPSHVVDQKKKPGRKPKARAVDDEDQEVRAMSKAAKPKKPGPKPKSAASRGNKGVESASEIDKGEESSRGRKTAKRKSTAATASRVSSPHTNSIDTAIHIPDSPDQATSSRPAVAKRRKLESMNEADSAIVLDTSFDDDDGIEILHQRSRSISPEKTTRQAPSKLTAGSGKHVHPFFGAKPREASVTPRAESLVNSISDREIGSPDVQSSDIIHVLSTMSKPTRTAAVHPDRSAHAFFNPKGKATEGDERVILMGRKPALGEPKPLPAVGKPGWGNGDVEARMRSARLPTRDEQAIHAMESGKGETGRGFRLGGFDMPKRQRKRSQTGRPAETSFWQNLYPREDVSTSSLEMPSQETSTNGVIVDDQAYKENPAVQALKAKKEQAGPNSTRLWVDKYRPTESSQVLGNEIPAKYLAKWMKELALGKEAKHVPGGSEKPSAAVTPKKRKIMRKVKRTRRKKDREDDWIVDDALDPIDDYLSADGTDTTGSTTEDENGNAVDISLGPPIYPAFSSRLANSILLQGPHGCGKTAAVYAAASELGWEVFEVNAGSKRSGAQLSAMVGEVGRNHMVGRSGHAGQDTLHVKPARATEPKRNALLQAFAKANGDHPQASSSLPPSSSLAVPTQSIDPQTNPFTLESVNSGIDGDDGANDAESVNFGFLDTAADGSSAGRGIRQSLILFEEVDILYEEDQGFWPQVVELIAGSKRPVVMTCSDLGLIPFERLPLQCTLLFSPPNAPLIEAYLQEIGHLEKGGSLPRAYLPTLLEASNYDHPTDVILQQPLAPVTLRQVKGIDLRMSIMQLQLDVGCTKSHPNGTLRSKPQIIDVASATQHWKDAQRQTEARSLVDAHLSLSLSSRLEDIEIDRYKPSADDEEGMHLVRKPLPPSNLPILPAFSRSTEIAQTVWEISGVQGDAQGDAEGSISRLARDRENYQLATLPFLDPVIPLESYLLPSPVLFTSYIPAISTMVAIDDTLEQEDAIDAAQGRPRKNRKTGRMMRLTTNVIGTPNYVRQMIASDDIGEKGLQAVRDCRLDFAIFNDDKHDNTKSGYPQEAADKSETLN